MTIPPRPDHVCSACGERGHEQTKRQRPGFVPRPAAPPRPVVGDEALAERLYHTHWESRGMEYRPWYDAGVTVQAGWRAVAAEAVTRMAAERDELQRQVENLVNGNEHLIACSRRSDREATKARLEARKAERDLAACRARLAEAEAERDKAKTVAVAIAEQGERALANYRARLAEVEAALTARL